MALSNTSSSFDILKISNDDLNCFLEREEDRIESLKSYQILDTAAEEDLDELTALAAALCKAPIALITLVDEDRQWFKSKCGLDIDQTERSVSFCQYTIKGHEIFEIPDALKDDRFSSNPLVLGEPYIRFYCGAPLINEAGYVLGSLCIIDRKPKKLTAHQKKTLALFAKQVVTHFELTKQKALLERQKLELEERVLERTSDLNEINQELNTFIYKASHDLRGPLATILGLAQLGGQATEDAEANPLFQNITQVGNKLDNTLKNLLVIVEMKEQPLKIETISLKEITEKILLAEILKKERIDLMVNLLDGHKFSTDPRLLINIIYNILENSIIYKQSYNPLHIKINISEIENWVQISIADNGEGIKDKVHNYIFDMFYKGSGKSKGSGLGLYIVKKAVQKLKGNIKFFSEENKGALFIIYLPK